MLAIELEGPCGHCENSDPIKFRQYRKKDGDFIGKYCKKCKNEWLKKDYLSIQLEECSGVLNKTDVVYQNTPIQPEVHKAFQIQSTRTKIENAETLKPGDQITWQRRAGYWHHSIVSEVNLMDEAEYDIVVIQWNKTDGKLKIVEESLPKSAIEGESLFNQMYRIDYSDVIQECNAPELVLARARSRISDTGYGPLSDNCEAFATYCKTGMEKSHQVYWVGWKTAEACGLGCVKSALKYVLLLAVIAIIPGEVTEAASSKATKGSEAVGAAFVIVGEILLVLWDLWQAYKEKRDNDMSRKVFVETYVRRILEGIITASCAIGVSIGMERGIRKRMKAKGRQKKWIIVGEAAGGISGGIIGAFFGKTIATCFGSCVGILIARCFQDDGQ